MNLSFLPEAPTLWTFHVLFVLAVIAGYWKGGPPERRGVQVLCAMLVVQLSAHVVLPSRFDGVDAVSLCVDLMGLLGFGWIALSAMRYWPVWAAALQLLSVSAHFARWVDLGLAPLAYAFMRSGPTFLVILVLLAGVVRHRLRLARLGSDPAWRSESLD